MTPEHAAKSTTEHGHQKAVMLWAWMAENYGLQAANDELCYSSIERATAAMQWAVPSELVVCKLLRLLHAIPNGGERHKAVAAKMKAEGAKRGVPDLCLPVPIGTYHGMYVEMKKPDDSRTSKEQKTWIKDLREMGYYVTVAYEWREAVAAITLYLTSRHQLLQPKD